MSQTLSIGGFTLTDSAWFTIKKRGLRGQTNRINKVRHTWIIDGFVKSTTTTSRAAQQAEVDAQVNALNAAVHDGTDIVFSLGSSMLLLSSATTEGTHVAEYDWLRGYDGVRGSGAEGVLRRSFHLVVFGDLLNLDSDTLITRYQDSLTAIGSGLSRTVPVGALVGGVQPQTVQNVTEFWAIQSGFSEGLIAMPTPPLPLYTGVAGVFYIPESMRVTPYTPRTWGVNQNLHFGIRWSFKCWSAFGLLGTPLNF